MRRAISTGLLDVVQTLLLTINPEKHTILPLSRNDLDKTKFVPTEPWAMPLEEVIVQPPNQKTKLTASK